MGGPRSGFGIDFGGLGVPLGAFGGQSAQEAAFLIQGRPFLNDFGAQTEPQRVAKWSYNQ